MKQKNKYLEKIPGFLYIYLSKEPMSNGLPNFCIMNKIKEAAKKMQYHCYIMAPIPDYVLQKLAILGYKTKLEKGDPRDPRETDNYLISW